MTPDARDRAVAEELARYASYAAPDGLIAAITAALATARAEERVAERARCVAELLETAENLTATRCDGDGAELYRARAAALRARGEG